MAETFDLYARDESGELAQYHGLMAEFELSETCVKHLPSDTFVTRQAIIRQQFHRNPIPAKFR